MTAVWTVERTRNRRFPFRIAIEQDGRLLAAFRAQAAWPGPGQQIFCLREGEWDGAEPLEPVERVPVAHVARVGRKLTVVLDRPQRKRCEFLVVRKDRKDGSGTYEQVFFRTETGIRAHRSRTRLEIREPSGTLDIVIDSGERYPWRFPYAETTRRKLAAGDYALVEDDRVVAVVERKSFDNLLHDVGALQALHQQLADLASYGAAAFVIEAQYADFLDEQRVKGRWPVDYLSRVLAEITVLHPGLSVIYAGNRKLANLWTHRFFAAVAAGREAPAAQLQLEVTTRYDGGARGPGLDERIRDAALREVASPFAMAELARRFPDAPVERVRRVVQQLRSEGRVRRVGAGRGARWERVEKGDR